MRVMVGLRWCVVGLALAGGSLPTVVGVAVCFRWHPLRCVQSEFVTEDVETTVKQVRVLTLASVCVGVARC